MILRLTRTLNTQLKGGPLATLSLHANPLLDWSVRSFVVEADKYFLLCNTPSLYCVVLDHAEIVNANQFSERVGGVVHAVLDGAGHGAVDHGSESVQFAKFLNRSVTGSLNELAAHATALLTDGDLSVHEVGVRLNEVLLSALASGSSKYGKPRDTFAAMVARAGA